MVLFMLSAIMFKTEVILKTLNNENKGILTVNVCEKHNPQIKIMNISADLDNEELSNDIINRNQLPLNSINIIHKYKQRNNYLAAIADVTSDAYAKIMKTKSVFVGYENCKVCDNFNIKRCKNCCGYNHSLKKCKGVFKRQQSCSKCAGEHNVVSCNSEEKNCINCINANKYLFKKRSINHSADDINSCETYKLRWDQYVSCTDYPWKPDSPFTSLV